MLDKTLCKDHTAFYDVYNKEGELITEGCIRDICKELYISDSYIYRILKGTRNYENYKFVKIGEVQNQYKVFVTKGGKKELLAFGDVKTISNATHIGCRSVLSMSAHPMYNKHHYTIVRAGYNIIDESGSVIRYIGVKNAKD